MNRDHMRAHSSDVERLVRVASSNGTELSPAQAYMAWSTYSDGYAAGWMMMPDSDEDLWFEAQYQVNRIVVLALLPEDALAHMEEIERIQRSLEQTSHYLNYQQVYDLLLAIVEDTDSAHHDLFGGMWDIAHLGSDTINTIAAKHLV